MSLFPPRTSNIDALAQFFDHVDSMDLSGVEDVTRLPEHKTELVTVSIRLLKDDVRSIKTLASQEGIPYSTLLRWMVHRFVQTLSK